MPEPQRQSSPGSPSGTNQALLNLGAEVVQHPRNFRMLTEKVHGRFRRNVAHVATEDDQVFRFSQRGFGDVEKARVILPTGPLGALDDIGGHRQRRTAELGREPEAFLAGERLCQTMDLERQGMASLPDFEFRESLQGVPL